MVPDATDLYAYLLQSALRMALQNLRLIETPVS